MIVCESPKSGQWSPFDEKNFNIPSPTLPPTVKNPYHETYNPFYLKSPCCLKDNMNYANNYPI